MRKHIDPGVGIDSYLPEVDQALSDLQQRHVIRRIWRGDHTVWKPEPDEITNRLGWLTVTDLMREQIPALETFAAGVRAAGFRHVVLLGMGGSSLGPEVLQRVFGSTEGYPQLIVLDSTVPAWVRATTSIIDPTRTLFLVSSKSGSTLESNTLYSYFRSVVDELVTNEQAGGHFVAITDPGTNLEKLAREHGFRHVFLNPPNIGGRYSVLSYFGLVPAALIGLDLNTLLDRADRMRGECAPCVAAQDNPGAWLGAFIATLAQCGRDKLTFVTSRSLGSFGLWAEQLVAESLGKEGRGIVPVVDEPVVSPDSYGDDRLFVYLRLDGDDNSEVDAAIQRIGSSGQPVLRLDLSDRYDIGSEFYRWEFAVAVVGACWGINPFDQPDVQSAKDMTESVLRESQSSDGRPRVEAAGSIKSLLTGASRGSYLAINAYLRQTPAIDRAVSVLRREIARRYGIATTFGYGPRYLHSTGQLHKGGPSSGLFLQISSDCCEDLPIPGYPYTFGTLADSQALGDQHALRSSGKPLASVRLGQDQEDGILKLADELN